MSHRAGRYDFEFKRARYVQRQFTYKISGSAVNLTGYTATLTVRTKPGSPTALLTLTSGSGITLGGSAGTVTVTITDAQSASLPSGVYSYDLELVSGGGQGVDFLEGSFKVSEASTR